MRYIARRWDGEEVTFVSRATTAYGLARAGLHALRVDINGVSHYNAAYIKDLTSTGMDRTTAVYLAAMQFECLEVYEFSPYFGRSPRPITFEFDANVFY